MSHCGDCGVMSTFTAEARNSARPLRASDSRIGARNRRGLIISAHSNKSDSQRWETCIQSGNAQPPLRGRIAFFADCSRVVRRLREESVGTALEPGQVALDDGT